MKPTLDTLFRLTESHVKPSSKILARAFQDNPIFIYRIPDASERKMKLKYLFEYAIRYDVLFGEVFSPSPNLEGVAGWIPYEKVYQTLEDQIRSGGKKILSKFGINYIKKELYLQSFLDSLHKRHAPFPHLFLKPLGVDPQFQGKGYGKLLLKAMFARVDQNQLPIYLETDREKNVTFYEKYGFKVMEEKPIPNTDIPIWAMLRKI